MLQVCTPLQPSTLGDIPGLPRFTDYYNSARILLLTTRSALREQRQRYPECKRACRRWRGNAHDRTLDRPIVVKELLGASVDHQRRFEREALITAKLQHPSIVPVYDAGKRDDGQMFYAMKKVAGRSLKEVIAETKTLDERLALVPKVLAVAEAIAYAHSRRIIHRDLKPSNVMIGEYGETVVIDWGLAKDLSDEDDADLPGAGPYRVQAAGDEVTVAGLVLGTPAYMPPEQARGEDVDERADVYSLGAMLYHVLAGKMPFDVPPTAQSSRTVIKS